ncbi:SAM hydroxide adenosyltransferase [Actinospica sp.]|uniref:SAM hydroxide adenosyltransferase n=1 Tax=Actinospica sp. TaxID=1872142 RepID=UPI002B624647|nr:SAM hydroxide adenosyltransferase [Actinospica sp.]HWG28534.1 SAM hydroxide adenosyltransferase [Actinospica sp.]
MSNPPVISLTDCTDPNAVARQTARLAALFGSTPTLLPLCGADPEGTTALTLLDVLRSTELLGGAGEPTVVLVNIAPRDGHWPNGVPFCYFRVREHLVISTLNPRVLAPVRRYLGVDAVEVTDVREVLEAAAAGWAEFTQAQVDEIARTQFRSLWYVPLLARWLVDGRPVPSRTELIAEGAGSAPRVAVVDNFGNCKLDVPADQLPGYAAGGSIPVLDGESGVPREVACYPRLVDVPRGEPGVITGSSGYGFAELVIRGGSAARLFGLREGDALLARRVQPEPALVT